MTDETGEGTYDVYWGDFHKHATQPPSNLERIDETIANARQHLDVYPVLCYPFENRMTGRPWGLRVESVGNRPKFREWWDQIQAAAARNNDPGEFVTFPAYEWHGNRRRWGDHNVVYFEEGGPLADTWDLPDLYATLRDLEVPAVALPHHTAYAPGERAKDWDAFDPDRSPVTEVYSSHGSSEGVGTPVPMADNPSMGPRTSGGSFQDALARGVHTGVIASNDGGGLPGSWNNGVAGLWATELTRDGIWEALTSRRTYGTTGDRIELWYTLNGEPMGSTVDTRTATARVAIACQRRLDRIELIHEDRVCRTYTHQGTWTYPSTSEQAEYRLLVEVGWGPNPSYGDWESTRVEWHGEVAVERGSLTGVQPRFNGWGQRYSVDGDRCRFDLATNRAEQGSTTSRGYVTTATGTEEQRGGVTTTQGFVLTVEGDAGTVLTVETNGREPLRVPLPEVLDAAHVTAFTEESSERISREFDVDPDGFENPDPVYHNAAKVKLHPAYPRTAYATTVTFDDLPVGADGEDAFYVRASQVDGQYAWSSPVWVS